MLEDTRERLLVRLVPEFGRSLGAVRSATQALLNGADSDRSFRRELLEGMDGELGRLQQQLDNLVHFEALSSGELKLEYQQIKVYDWLDLGLEKWRQRARDRSILWEEEIPEKLPTLVIDPDRMALVLDNLLRNAFEYASSEGTISVQAGSDHRTLWIEVSDNGPGITREEIELISKMIIGKRRGSRFPGGLGLGLPVARELVRAHGGQLDMGRKDPRGSRFVIQLPLSGDRRIYT